MLLIRDPTARHVYRHMPWSRAHHTMSVLKVVNMLQTREAATAHIGSLDSPSAVLTKSDGPLLLCLTYLRLTRLSIRTKSLGSQNQTHQISSTREKGSRMRHSLPAAATAGAATCRSHLIHLIHTCTSPAMPLPSSAVLQLPASPAHPAPTVIVDT